MTAVFSATNQAQRRAELRRQDRERAAVEVRMRNALIREFNRIARELARTWNNPTALRVALTEHGRRLNYILRTYTHAVSRDAFRAANDSPKRWGFTVNIKRSLMDEFFAVYDTFLLERSRTIEDSTRNVIEAIVADSLAEQLGPAEVGRTIRAQIEGIGISRSETIARTETHTAQQSATRYFAEDVNEEIPLMKVWVATEDERTRQTHKDADGQQRSMNEPFEVGGAALMMPGDPGGPPEEIINCRCVATYEPAQLGD